MQISGMEKKVLSNLAVTALCEGGKKNKDLKWWSFFFYFRFSYSLLNVWAIFM